jgi:hypothetical protein
MFVYRHFGKWGFGVGLPTFLFLILPLWLAFEVLKAACLAVGFVTVETFRVIRWAWHEYRARPKEEPKP